MAQYLLLSLLLSVLWSAALWGVSQPLLKKSRAMQQWPTLYWWLLALSFLPLLPIPVLFKHWTIPSVLLQDTVHSVQVLAAQPMHPALLSTPVNTGLYWQIALAFIATVSLIQLARLARQWQQLQRFIRHSTRLAPDSLFTAAQLQQIAPVAQRFTLRQTEAAISPFIAGWFKLTLVVPAYIWQMSAQQRQLLLSHELIHLQRRDPQQLLIMRMLIALCWFNPVLRRIEAAFIRSMELAVDKAVLATQPQLAALYGQTLLASLTLNQPQKMPQLMPGFIQASADKQFYQQRLQQLFQPAAVVPLWQKWRTAILLCCSALLLNTAFAQLNFSTPPATWQLPVSNVPVSSFYAEQHPFRDNRPHQGLDFAAQPGTTVKAAQKGRVLITDDTSLHQRYGKVVLIDHGHGYQTLYAHLDGFDVVAGQTVEPGQPIGKVGATGRVTGPHLHFELLLHGKQQDPAPYLPL
ncbi:M23/M56 family metallopeptidase [Rheinheimera pacifica]|uniref:M23/M56 family metallopeptidase n=1 Tax=Rheinheimera pacifica TaxID=173990 RepID=UPI002ED8F012